MTPTDLRAMLTTAGVSLTLSNDYMDYKLLAAPRSAITPELRALIALHRDTLIDLLYTEWRDSMWPAVDSNTSAIRWACALSDEMTLKPVYVFNEELPV